MSVPRSHLIIAPSAREDLRDIFIYGAKTWGTEQAEHYESLVYQALDAIRDNPMIGQEFHTARSAMRVFLVERHVVLYRLLDEQAEVLRIVHSRMNVMRVVARLSD